MAKIVKRKDTKTARKLQSAFHEVKHNQPKIVTHTLMKYGAERAEKQRTVIALNKARKKGARIPKRKS